MTSVCHEHFITKMWVFTRIWAPDLRILILWSDYPLTKLYITYWRATVVEKITSLQIHGRWFIVHSSRSSWIEQMHSFLYNWIWIKIRFVVLKNLRWVPKIGFHKGGWISNLRFSLNCEHSQGWNYEQYLETRTPVQELLEKKDKFWLTKNQLIRTSVFQLGQTCHDAFQK